ncbi:hypothetical protein [Actinosynnema sp. NPDC020468]|uniref:hypothetical protein n=1 Tax=Actinosynnema sp. NPDC020468 TaxID=3154488 RepID=UPI0034076928
MRPNGWPAFPERTALLEADGALLAWDVLAGSPVPAVRVHDEARAADWLWEVYGAAADAVLAGEDVDVPEEGDRRVRDACRVAAHLSWARSWWPASASAGVPALDPVLLHAERALAVAAVEHLLDDPDATARALAEVGPVAAATSDPEVDALVARLVEVAEDYGVVPDQVVPRRSAFALAAGGSAEAGLVVLSGQSSVDWNLVPQGVVDAAAPATWSVARRDGGTFLDVVVPAGPRGGVPLAARFGDLDVVVDGVDDLGRLTGSAPAPATALLLPPDRRVLTVYAPGFAEPVAPEPDAAPRRAAVVAYALARVGAAEATLTERVAGR